jgi:hypothetical protein
VALAGVLGMTLAARLLPAVYRGVEVSDLSIYRHMALIVLRAEDIYEVRNIFPYTPLSLFLPAFALQLSEWLHQPFHLVMKIYPLLGDLGTATVIFLLARRRDSAGRACLLGLAFALNPVSILITAFHGNIMPLSVFFAFWAYYLLDHPDREGTYLLSALALGMGIGLRSWPVLLLPFLLRPRQLRWRQRLLYLFVASLPSVLTLGPYLLVNFDDIRREVFEYKSVADLGWVGAWRAYYFLKIGSRGAPQAFLWLSNSRFYFLEAYGAVVVAAWVVPALLDTAGWIATVLLLNYTVMGGMAAQYYCWVLPFLIGYPVYYAAFSLVVTGALITFYLALHPGIVLGPSPPPFAYTQPQIFAWNLGFLIATWVVGAGWLLWVVRQLFAGRRAATLPPLAVLQPGRLRWVTFCTLALSGALAGALALELPFIVHSRPPAELPADIVWSTAGRGPEPGHFDGPIGLAVHPSGDIYLVDLGYRRVQRFDSSGRFVSLWETKADAPLRFWQPSDVAIGSDGTVYVLDASAMLYRLKPNGGLELAVNLVKHGASNPRGLTIDESRHRFYIADAGRGRVLVLGTDGSFIGAWGGTGTALSFFEPSGIAVDSHGNVFVAEPATSRIRKLGPDGKLLAEWKAKGALFDIAVGPDDRVYVSSTDRGRVWIYDNDGKVLGQAYDSLTAANVPQARALAVPGDVVLATESSLVRFSVHLDGKPAPHLKAEVAP